MAEPRLEPSSLAPGSVALTPKPTVSVRQGARPAGRWCCWHVACRPQDSRDVFFITSLHQHFSLPKLTLAFGALDSVFFFCNFALLFVLHTFSLDWTPPFSPPKSTYQFSPTKFSTNLASDFNYQPLFSPPSPLLESSPHALPLLHAWSLPESHVSKMVFSPPILLLQPERTSARILTGASWTEAALHFHFILSHICALAHILPSTWIAFPSLHLLIKSFLYLFQVQSFQLGALTPFFVMTFWIASLIYTCVSSPLGCICIVSATGPCRKRLLTQHLLDVHAQTSGLILNISSLCITSHVAKLMGHLFPCWQELNAPKFTWENFLSSHRTTSDPLEASRSAWFLRSQGVLIAKRK